MRKLTLIGIAALATALLVLAPAAFAGGERDDRGVIKSGRCSAGATWKLKSKLDDGRLETEFEVDQNRVGRSWRVTIVKNGARVFSGIRRTVAPSGSFEVRRLLGNAPGADRITATARALGTGQTCRGSLAI
jgi:hypothetical protein